MAGKRFPDRERARRVERRPLCALRLWAARHSPSSRGYARRARVATTSAQFRFCLRRRAVAHERPHACGQVVGGEELDDHSIIARPSRRRRPRSSRPTSELAYADLRHQRRASTARFAPARRPCRSGTMSSSRRWLSSATCAGATSASACSESSWQKARLAARALSRPPLSQVGRGSQVGVDVAQNFPTLDYDIFDLGIPGKHVTAGAGLSAAAGERPPLRLSARRGAVGDSDEDERRRGPRGHRDVGRARRAAAGQARAHRVQGAPRRQGERRPHLLPAHERPSEIEERAEEEEEEAAGGEPSKEAVGQRGAARELRAPRRRRLGPPLDRRDPQRPTSSACASPRTTCTSSCSRATMTATARLSCTSSTAS